MKNTSRGHFYIKRQRLLPKSISCISKGMRPFVGWLRIRFQYSTDSICVSITQRTTRQISCTCSVNSELISFHHGIFAIPIVKYDVIIRSIKETEQHKAPKIQCLSHIRRMRSGFTIPCFINRTVLFWNICIRDYESCYQSLRKRMFCPGFGW